MWKRLLCASVLVMSVGGVALPQAFAADPNPGCPSDPEAAGVALQNSVRFADDNPGTTIELTAGCTYTLRQDDSTATYLPITASTTIHGNGATVNRPFDTEHFLLFEVYEGVTLTMSNVNLSSGIDGHGHLKRIIWIRPSGTGTFDHLAVDQGGPAIYNGGTLNVDDSSFSHINARATFGGAIENGGTLSVERSTFTSNHVWGGLGEPQSAGAISNGGTAYISESTFTLNDGFVGGAITNGSSLDVRDTTFDRNSAVLDGGALYQNNGSTLFLRDTFKGNNVERNGGAIHAYGGNVSIYESTFSANRAVKPQFTSLVPEGGAVYSATTMYFENNTFADNVAEHGTAVFRDATSGSLTMFGNVLKGNGDLCEGDTTIDDAGYNLQSTSSSACPDTFAVGNPLLGALGNHGGKTETILPGANSPLLDAIPVDSCPTKDQRNFDRPAGAGCEIGSVEDQLPSQPGQVTLASGTNPNQGDFGLEWDPSTDSEGSVTYNLYRQDDDDSAPSLVAATSTPDYTFTSGSPEQEGTLVYWAEAVDNAGQTAMSDPGSDPIVVDRSAPTGLTATADRVPDYDGPSSGDEWYADTVTVTFGNATDPALPDGSDGSGVSSTTTPVTYTSGTHTASGTATDAVGNTSQTASLTVQVDADSPTVSFDSCPTTVLLNASSSIGWTAQDASSGLSSAATGTVPLVTSSIGSHQVQSPAPTDNVDHTGTAATCAYTVIYDFTGFLGLPTYPGFSSINSSQGTSVRFSLAGDQGLAVLATAPTSLPIDCKTGVATGAATSAATNKGLTYNSANGTYAYQWITDRSMAKTCRQFVMTLDDGTVHRANFRFK